MVDLKLSSDFPGRNGAIMAVVELQRVGYTFFTIDGFLSHFER